MAVADRSRPDNFGDLLHFFAARSFVALTSLLRSLTPGRRNGAVGTTARTADGAALASLGLFTLKENSCGVA
jgi:hypothetical protein